MKYIGNKSNLLGFIEESLRSANVPIQGEFTDLFAGTTSVAEHFKKLGLTITSNDFMTYSFVLQKAFIGENKIPNFDGLRELIDFKFTDKQSDAVIEYLNGLGPTEGYAFKNYGEGGEANRMYFTGDNAGRIDSIREQIKDWSDSGRIGREEEYYLLAALIDAADHVANMSGTYGAFLKIWRSVALKTIKLKSRDVYDNGKTNFVFQEKAESLIEKISGDILYLDPPYNSRQYAPNFHVLESIAVWDKQELSGKTGLRNYDSQKSDFSSRAKAADALKKIISEAKFKFIALSYNNEGIIPHEEILEIMNTRGKLEIFTQDYRRFRTERDHENRRYKDVGDKTQEYLFVLAVRD